MVVGRGGCWSRVEGLWVEDRGSKVEGCGSRGRGGYEQMKVTPYKCDIITTILCNEPS